MPKRRHGRVRAEGVTSQLRFLGTAKAGHAVENLSLGGAFVRGADALPVGSKLTLELGHPGLKVPLRLQGRVVSMVRKGEAAGRQAAGLGIAFEPYADETMARLRQLLLLLAPGEALLDGDALDLPEFSRAATQPQFVAVPAPPPSARRTGTAESAPVIHGTAVPSANPRLAEELARAQKELATAAARVKWLEAENQNLKDDLAKVRRALFQLRHG